MSETREEKFWGANKTVEQRVAAVPNLTERETNLAISFPSAVGALYIALEKHQFGYRIARANQNAMGVLLRTDRVDRVRYAAGLMTSIMTSLDDGTSECIAREAIDRLHDLEAHLLGHTKPAVPSTSNPQRSAKQ